MNYSLHSLQVNLNFASRTWYSQQGARGLHKTLGYDAKGQKFISPQQASLPRARSEEGWNPRHTLLLRNEGLQTNTRSYFDRRLEMPEPRKRNEPARKRSAMVPTLDWTLRAECLNLRVLRVDYPTSSRESTRNLRVEKRYT